MHFISLRSTAALAGAVLALGSIPTLASAEGGNVPSITIVTPTSGGTVGGTTQPVTIKAPAGTTDLIALCDHTVGPAPRVPATWSPQASDGTITGTINFAYCLNGSNTLTVVEWHADGAQSAPVPITVANPGALDFGPNASSTSFAPDGTSSTLPKTITLEGGYLQADKITVRVLDAHGHLVNTLTTTLERHPFGSLRYTATWDGHNARGRLAKAGTYTLQVVAWTAAGGHGPSKSTTVDLVRQHRGHHKGHTAS